MGRGTLRVMMLPWLAHGHVSPFLELAKRLSQDDRIGLVHFCSTPVNLGPVRDHLSKLKAAFPSSTILSYRGDKIRPVELHLPPALPGLEQPHLHTTKHLPPALMPALKHALDLAEPSFCRLLDALRPDLLIYDFLQPWAPLAAQRRGIPAFHFMTSGAASTAFFCHYGSRTSAEAFPFPAIRLGSPDEDVQYAAMLNKEANGLSDKDRLLRSLERSSGFIAIKSFREIESEYIGYLSSLAGKEVVPVGPLVPDADPADDDDSEGRRQLERVVGWLGKRGAGSVVFVSFGTEYFMTEEETEELACGLELSGASFIWVVRFPPREDEERDEARAAAAAATARALPRGFVERVVAPAGRGEEEDEGGRGMVLEGWAPQRSILAHPSVGAFLTHCGWSSVMEGMRFGVPMVALPLHLDQPMNARLVVELGVGVACSLPPRPHEATFKRDDVARGIREVLLPATERGQGVASKAKEMAEMMSRKGDAEVQSLVQKMAALCYRDKRPPVSRKDDT